LIKPSAQGNREELGRSLANAQLIASRSLLAIRKLDLHSLDWIWYSLHQLSDMDSRPRRVLTPHAETHLRFAGPIDFADRPRQHLCRIRPEYSNNSFRGNPGSSKRNTTRLKHRSQPHKQVSPSPRQFIAQA